MKNYSFSLLCVHALFPLMPFQSYPFTMSSFRDLKSITDLTQAETDELKQRCFKDCQEIDGHILYKGQDGPNYSQITFTLRSKRYHLRKAQLSLFLKLKEVGYDMASWTMDMSTSHLCHKKACIKPEHLVLETNEENRERDGCMQSRQGWYNPVVL